MRGGIRARLILVLIGLAVMPTLAISIGLVWRSFQDQRGLSIKLQQETARRVAAQISAFFRELEGELRVAGESPALFGPDRNGQTAILAALRLRRDDSLNDIILLDAGGRELVRASRLRIAPPLPLLPDLSQSGEFAAAGESRTVSYGPVRFEADTGEPVVYAAMPLIDARTDAMKGTLVAEIRLKRIRDLIAAMPVGRGQDVYMTDAGGRIIAHRSPSVVLKNTVVDTDVGGGIRRGLNDQLDVMAADTVGLGNRELTVIVEQSQSEALVSAFNSILIAGPVIAAAVTAAIGLGILFVQRIIRPLRLMADAAGAISGGDLSRRVEIGDHDEVGALADAFNAMTARLRSSLEEVEWYFANAIDLQCMVDREGRLRRMNKAWETVLGYSVAEIQDRPFMDYIHSDDRQRTREAVSGLLEKKEAVEFVTRCIRKDGGIRWLEWRVFPFRDLVYAAARDITKRKEFEDEVRILNESLELRVEERTGELEAINRELESFAYSIAHDLRTPLRAINGYTHIISERYAYVFSEKDRGLFATIQAETRRMDELIGSLLDFTRIGRHAVKPEVLDMTEMARSAFQKVLEAHRRSGVSFNLGALPEAVGDASLICQVWTNLLDNAVKFSSPRDNAAVSVEGSTMGSEIVYGVRDNGVGFDMRFADKLFGVFQRLHAPGEFEGTGIGLALVSRIVSMHGGRVWAEGETGRGASFFFTLPVDAPFTEL